MIQPAQVAQKELDSMKEHMTMGVKARLKAGKANTGQDHYRYQRVGDQIVVVEEEARWVRKIFAWYSEGCHLMEIHNRLIAANVCKRDVVFPGGFSGQGPAFKQF